MVEVPPMLTERARMDTLWSPCFRSASAAWLLVGSRWSSELFVEQVIFHESVVGHLRAAAAAEDPGELDLDLCQSLWLLRGQRRRLQESMRAAWVSLEGLAGPPCHPSRPLLI